MAPSGCRAAFPGYGRTGRHGSGLMVSLQVIWTARFGNRQK
ncbi:hypothetical protein C725_1868 [Pacificimonas flava]|uniref:Uncharacterized protein n=1 Tax=Pacificimonas flava TaxID=1234595 RepID=M2U4C9_9SPHN|nr:hypothetical protein C725_1868 [Pacificimonas flava]